MKKDAFIQTPLGPLFENPDLAKLVIDELREVDLREIFVQPSVLVSGDDCAEHRVSGILYVAFTKDNRRISNQFVAQGILARSIVDPFGKDRVRKAIETLRQHFKPKGVSVNEVERLHK